MIKARFTGVDSLKSLSNDLKKLKNHINKQERNAIETLHKSITVLYEKHIHDLVYDQYDPEEYKRTFHLAGGHGAKDESVDLSGTNKHYKFSIDEDSRDPEDGTTWKMKADKIESGDMSFKQGQTPFGRPFIKETQEALEHENRRTADAFERSVIALIDRIARG